jgi:type I restriction enzyme S subunit
VQLGPKELSIPSVWNLTTFEEANESEKPIGYGVVKPGPHTENGIPLIRITDVIDGRLEADQDFHRISDELDDQYSRSRLDGGELLISIQGTVGEVVVVPPELDGANISRTLARITPGEGLNTYWVKYFLESKEAQDYIEVVSSGSTRASYNIGDIRKTKLPVPTLPKQRKIASVLYAVDQAIHKTEAIIEQAKRVKRGLMQDLFHGRHKSHGEYKSTSVGEVPSHWDVESIGSVVEMAQYGISESMSDSGEYPIFRMNNIENGYMIDEPMKYIDLDEDEFEKYRVEKQDILFNRTNSLELVGKTGIFALEGDYVFASYLVRLRANDRVDANYLNYYMNSYEGQNRMMDFATKGVSQANINANSIQQVKCPVPPKNEQTEIVSQLRAIDQEIEHNKVYVSQLRPLKTGLMQDLLTGEVRTADKAIKVLDEVVAHG